MSDDDSLYQDYLRQIGERGPRAHDALAKLYDRFHKAVLGSILRVAPISRYGDAIPLELGQDVWMKVWESAAAKYNPKIPVIIWFRTLARNEAINYLKPKGRSNKLASFDEISEHEQGVVHPEDETFAFQNCLKWAMEQITKCCPECERVLGAKILDDASAEDLADILQTTKRAATQKLYECRNCLRELIDRCENTGSQLSQSGERHV